MRVREGMSGMVLTIGPSHTLRDAAEAMCRRNVGAAGVPDPEALGNHLTSNLTLAAPDWSLERAAAPMVRGSFRHLVVYEGGELTGILSMRDIMRCWIQDGATSEAPVAVTEA